MLKCSDFWRFPKFYFSGEVAGLKTDAMDEAALPYFYKTMDRLCGAVQFALKLLCMLIGEHSCLLRVLGSRRLRLRLQHAIKKLARIEKLLARDFDRIDLLLEVRSREQLQRLCCARFAQQR